MSGDPPYLRFLAAVAAEPITMPTSVASGERPLTSAEAEAAREVVRRAGDGDRVSSITLPDGTVLSMMDELSHRYVLVESPDGTLTGRAFRPGDDVEQGWFLQQAQRILPATWDTAGFWFLWRGVAQAGHREFLAVVEHISRQGRPEWWMVWHHGPGEIPVDVFDTVAKTLQAIQDVAPSRKELWESAPHQMRRNRDFRRAALLLEARLLGDGVVP
jgi:hypothetical protein